MIRIFELGNDQNGTVRIRSIKTLASLYSGNRPLDILDVLGSNFRPTYVHFERCKFVNL